MTANYFDITSLPALGELGSQAPIQPADMLARLEDGEAPHRLVGTVFLLDDLLQRESFAAGEIDEVSPAVLTSGQARSDQALPSYLAGESQEQGAEEGEATTVTADLMWEGYFRYAWSQAEELNSSFLRKWVGFEVALRNALSSERAKRLELDPSSYMVAPDLSGNEDFGTTINEWTSAQTPLDGEKAVVRGKWEWVKSNDAWFTFGDDELCAYAVKLMLLKQYRRLSHASEKTREEDEG
jgi:hypothetical protein